jgi:hypothetical protein
MTSISGKTPTDWAAFAAAPAPVELIDETVPAKKRSRDFFWCSPILDLRPKTCFGDPVARPKSPTEMATCPSLSARYRVPVTRRGGDIGKFGRSVPMEDELIIDSTAMDDILEIGTDFFRVQAGCNILKLNEALKTKGRELPVFPSTQDIATIGSFNSGGPAGTGSVSHGMLRDAGNILEISPLSAEQTPRVTVFTGDRINMIHHPGGTNDVISELTLRTVPTEDWIGCIATFADYRACYRAGMALGVSDIRQKLCSTMSVNIGTCLDQLKGIIPEGRAMLVTLVPGDQMESLRALIAAHYGTVDLEMDSAARQARKLPHAFEPSFNQATLQAIKTDRKVTCLQTLCPAPLNVAQIIELQAALGDDVFMHLEFSPRGSQRVTFVLPLVTSATDARLYAIMDICKAHGCPASDPLSCIIEEGAMKAADCCHPASEKRMDPAGLLNCPKSRGSERVRDLTPEAIKSPANNVIRQEAA